MLTFDDLHFLAIFDCVFCWIAEITLTSRSPAILPRARRLTIELVMVIPECGHPYAFWGIKCGINGGGKRLAVLPEVVVDSLSSTCFSLTHFAMALITMSDAFPPITLRVRVAIFTSPGCLFACLHSYCI